MMNQKQNKLPAVTFSSFSEEQAKRAFNLKIEIDSTNILNDWFQKAIQQEVSKEEEKQLLHLQKKLRLYIRGWNEYELSFKFITPVIELVNYDDFDLKVAFFAERPIAIKHKKTLIHGVVDGMVASGQLEPHQPYFFIHEYKREKDPSGDPAGQLLAMMCTAQILNAAKVEPNLFFETPSNLIPTKMYGCYVIGRFWFFVALQGENYGISKAFDSEDKADLIEIVKLLKAQKEMIFSNLQQHAVTV